MGDYKLIDSKYARWRYKLTDSDVKGLIMLDSWGGTLILIEYNTMR